MLILSRNNILKSYSHFPRPKLYIKDDKWLISKTGTIFMKLNIFLTYTRFLIKNKYVYIWLQIRILSVVSNQKSMTRHALHKFQKTATIYTIPLKLYIFNLYTLSNQNMLLLTIDI